MKFFHRFRSKLLYLLLCLFIVSCSEKDDIVEPKPDPEPTPVETNYLLKDGVVEIKGNDLKYIVEVQEGSILVLSDDFPSGAMPSVGEIVFVYPNAEKLACGFLGKVSKIEQMGETYHLITEQVALDEAFSYLEFDETIDFEPVIENVESASRLAVENINGYNCLRQGIEFTFDIKKVKVKVQGELTLGIRIRAKTYIDDKKNKKEQIIQLSRYASFNSTTHLTGSVDEDKIPKIEIPINALKLKIPAGVVSLFACPEIVPKFVVKLDAALNVGLGNDFSCEETFTVAYKDDKWSFDYDETTGMEKEPALNLLPQGLISMQGSVFAGIAISPEVKLFGRDDMKISINPSVGLRGKAELDYNSETDKSLYDALKDDGFTTSLAVMADVGAKANIFKLKAEWSADLFEKDFFPRTGYLFPSFSNHSLAYANGEISASTDLGRDLLWKQDVGLALYKGDECIERSDSVEYKFAENFKEENPLEAVFKDIPEEKKYECSVWSYVKWGDFYVKCKQLTPKKKIHRIVEKMYELNSCVYDFSYENDTVSRIVTQHYSFGVDGAGTKYSVPSGTDTYIFNFIEDGSVSVVGRFYEGGDYSMSLTLNEDGYIESLRRGGDFWKFEYNDAGQCVKVSENNIEYNIIWNIAYNDFNAISVTNHNDYEEGDYKFTYGNMDNVSNMVLMDEIYSIDMGVLNVFGMVGMLGKPSKNLPVLYPGDGKPTSLNWSLDNDGYPDKLSKANGWCTYSFSWE